MNKNVAIAEAYYIAMKEKKIAEMEKYLHPNVRAVGPLGEMVGKEAVIEALKRLVAQLKTLEIRAKFGSNEQAMLAINLEFTEPIGNVPSAVLITFKDGLIAKNELFFDARPFGKK